ncbi:MAG: type 4a pilus biogenesis protein PilO [Nitrospira sp.]|jgi:type IV pilus assembly protein PilO|uniref:type 4a pilus biogenesis protein PilO n=1 Tax=Nitrospira sp. BLG_1 TaxID=3395883 RepID=UPI001DBD6815|nr:type 4a pilus biogenesis protein PilO [Nitrospira sp.]MBX3350006.1 type 4a pilus biogenesis protein PilO [Nitrospira sp.]
MALPQLNLDALRSVPASQKVALLLLLVGGMIAGFYFYIAEPKSESIAALEAENTKLESEIQTLTIKVKHLDELVAANKQLEIELAKKKERLPPEEEAIMLLKQVSDLGVRLGLDIKLWRPGAQAEDPSKLFVKMPVSVEVAGVYHTAALFFDRINRLPRIITVSGLKMGSPRMEQGRFISQTTFDLIAYAAPQEKPVSGTAQPVPASKVAQAGK